MCAFGTALLPSVPTFFRWMGVHGNTISVPGTHNTHGSEADGGADLGGAELEFAVETPWVTWFVFMIGQ